MGFGQACDLCGRGLEDAVNLQYLAQPAMLRRSSSTPC